MVFIYILELEKGKYYIGKTNNVQFRLENHFNSNGSEWTKLYKPIKVLELISNCDDYDEDKYTRIYMDKYGINNVRGGSFVSIKLDKATIKTLKQMNNGTNDKCFICNKKGHFAKNCPDEEDEDEDEDEYEDEDEDEDEEENNKVDKFISESANIFLSGIKFISNIYNEYNEKNTCSRCGRNTHNIKSCYAKTHKLGYKID
jgi:hypothetical protein